MKASASTDISGDASEILEMENTNLAKTSSCVALVPGVCCDDQKKLVDVTGTACCETSFDKDCCKYLGKDSNSVDPTPDLGCNDQNSSTKVAGNACRETSFDKDCCKHFGKDSNCVDLISGIYCNDQSSSMGFARNACCETSFGKDCWKNESTQCVDRCPSSKPRQIINSEESLGDGKEKQDNRIPASGVCVSNCCSDKNGLQCDEECVKLYAAYECATASEDDAIHKGKHPSSDNACSSHLQAAFERYAFYLRTARCLCRNVLSSPVVRCCERRYEKKSEAAATGHTVSFNKSTSLNTRKYQRPKRQAGDFGRCSWKARDGGYHVNLVETGENAYETDGCCKKDMTTSPIDIIESPHRNIYSGETEARHETENKKRTKIKATREATDIENAAAREHVVIRVQGMTCTGCENKLRGTLQRLPGISNARVTFATGLAEFDVDPSKIGAEDAIRQTEEKTGFGISRVLDECQTIDVYMDKASAKALIHSLPSNVVNINLLNRATIRLTFNPKIVGARDLMHQLGDKTTGLAPRTSNHTLSAEKSQLMDMLFKTILSFSLTIPVVILSWARTSTAENTKAIVCLVLASFVQLIAVRVFYQPALKSLLYNKTVELDMLVVLSTTAAYIYSVVAFKYLMLGRPLETRALFETSTLLISLVLSGRLVVAYSRAIAIAALSSQSLPAMTAIIVHPDNKQEQIDARLLQFGDRFVVQVDAKIPTDGVILEGISEVDESMLTGESTPVPRSPGDRVVAGTMNRVGILKVELTRLPGKNTVTDIANLVEQANSIKPNVQDLADRIAGYFVPGVGIIAAIVFLVWLGIGLQVRDENSGTAASTALIYAIAVLAVSCPCALGLAVPMVIVGAGGVAARGGVILKSGKTIEIARRVTDVVFDKTGTLTTVDLDVASVEVIKGDDYTTLSLAYALIMNDKHPVSLGVARHLTKQGLVPPHVDNIKYLPGAGLEAKFHGAQLRAGNPHWLGLQDHPLVRPFLMQGMTILCVVQDTQLLAIFSLTSTLRPGAKATIQSLRSRNISTHLASGDNDLAVHNTARELGIPASNVRTLQNPTQKAAYVQSLLMKGKIVAFLGDGTNDAPALAQSCIGIQIGTTSDVTRATADVILLGNNLEALIFLLEVSQAAYRRIVFNFVWASVYNVFAILLAGGAFVKAKIPPAYAGLGEIVSVLPVVLAGLTMLRIKSRV